MASLFTAITFLLALSINYTSAAHAGFHVQYPWMSRGPNPKTRPGLDQYNPFCREILHNPQRYSRRSRSFLSFSGHPGDLVTVLYTRYRVPKKRDDFPHIILQNVPIQPSGQLCVNITIPFETEADEMGVMYFDAMDPKTRNVEHHCTDVKMTEMNTLPEDHPAMCAAYNETLIPMPDEYL
ncbi:Nn.00g110890.m01.CDS01 [Neocucurbitaria sp. VM-36]